MDDFELEMKQSFLEEAAQLVADVEQCFLELEANPSSTENLNKIFRLAHNLKGSSKAVGFEEFSAFTHEFETFILKVKNGQLAATAGVVSLLLNVNDRVSQMIDGLRADLSAKFENGDLLTAMQTYTENEAGGAPTPSAAAEVPNVNAEDWAAPVAVKAKAAVSADESIRVSLAKVEAMINSVGELVILQSVMREQAHGEGSMLFRNTVHQLGKVIKEVQDLSMSLRMIPIKPTFQKMQRIVRDVAQALDKDVSIELKGEDTELDKTVLEKLNDPLVHLIRNSVDHGIESREVRLAKNKPAGGKVVLSAYHQAGRLILEVRDDGAGLDAEKLKRKAAEKGLIAADANLTEKECFNLIFAPGFSTKEAVTEVSGRGVGMDVVRTNIQELGGDVHIESRLGEGTVFTVSLPLTLAIIDAMVVTYSGQRFVMPLTHVFENLKPSENHIHHDKALGDVLMLRGENMPLHRLGDYFGLKSQLPTQEMIAMVVRSGAKPFAILVDDIIGRYQVVIKNLSPELQGMKGVSGSTILGDGRPALILEPQDLTKRRMTPGFERRES